jgi:hypothetical protein
MIRERLGDGAFLRDLLDELLGQLDSREARRAAAWGSAAGADDTFFLMGEVTSVELSEVADADAEKGYAVFNAAAEGEYEFPVFYSEAWEAEEDGELDKQEHPRVPIRQL